MALANAGKRPFTEAIAAFEQSRSADPPIPTVFLSLGTLYTKVSKPAEAIEAFTRFLEVAPADNVNRSYAESKIAELRALPASPAPSP